MCDLSLDKCVYGFIFLLHKSIHLLIFSMPNPTVTLHTNHGDITLEVFADKVPKTAKNFVELAKKGYYDGTIFHRVIKDFMIQ